MKSFSIGQRPSLISDMAKDLSNREASDFSALMALHAGSDLGVLPSCGSLLGGCRRASTLNATLVHDDLQDGDEVRRGEPTLWKKYGAGQAINAGDLMLMVPYQLLSCLDVEGEMLRCMFGSFSNRTIQTVRGQSLEMTLRDSLNFDRETYIQALRGKTGQLLALAVEGPLMLSKAAPEEISQRASPSKILASPFRYTMTSEIFTQTKDVDRSAMI